MAVLFAAGCESGDTSEFPTLTGSPLASTAVIPFSKGGYSLLYPASTGGAAFTPTGSSSSVFARVAFNSNVVTSNVADQRADIILFQNTALAGIARVQQVAGASSSGTLALRLFNVITATQIGSAFTISPNTDYWVEAKLVVSATVGVLELRVNGVVVATGSGLNTGTTNYGRTSFGGGALTNGSGNSYLDHMLVSDSAYPGPGYHIARQLKAGTPTNDTWTKNGAATAALCWSDTPFSAATNCSSATNNQAQTALIASFNTAGSAPEGNGIISSTDILNAARVFCIAKASAGTGMSIRRRVGGANTDTAVTLTAADAGYGETPWIPTYANLTDGTTEIGVLNTNTTGNTDTVEDMWLMVDYTPGPQAVVRRPYRRRRPVKRAGQPTRKIRALSPPAATPRGLALRRHGVGRLRLLRQLRRKQPIKSTQPFSASSALVRHRVRPQQLKRSRLRKSATIALRRPLWVLSRLIGRVRLRRPPLQRPKRFRFAPNVRLPFSAAMSLIRRHPRRQRPSRPRPKGLLLRTFGGLILSIPVPILRHHMSIRRPPVRRPTPLRAFRFARIGLLPRFALLLRRSRARPAGKKLTRSKAVRFARIGSLARFVLFQRQQRARAKIALGHVPRAPRFGSIVAVARGFRPLRHPRPVLRPLRTLFRRIARAVRGRLFPSFIPCEIDLPLSNQLLLETPLYANSAAEFDLVAASLVAGYLTPAAPIGATLSNKVQFTVEIYC